ncbi:MAG TPA: Gfo/Idh/MocA family oxidoreductase [Spirochaetota bacterium]|nr:Gfo/Idh/MocA family oxidoreductase [Spirochaetota bacterium]
MQKIKYGVIGTGHMGTYHVNVASNLNEIDFIGVYDIDQAKSSRTATQFNTTNYNTAEDLLKECDAVSIAVPTTLHYEIGKLAIKHQTHILLEKPICNIVSQAEELISLAEKQNIILEVGHVERFNGAVQELLTIINKPLLWESRRLGPNTGRIHDVGVVMDLMIHDIDICLRVINDKVKNINAYGRNIISNCEDLASASLEFENGCIATLTTSRVTQEKIRTLSISQPDSYLYLDFTTQDLQIHKQATSKISTSTEKIHYKQAALIERLFIHKENPLKSEILNFITNIKNNQNSVDTNKTDLETLKITSTILEQITRT